MCPLDTFPYGRVFVQINDQFLIHSFKHAQTSDNTAAMQDSSLPSASILGAVSHPKTLQTMEGPSNYWTTHSTT